MCDLNVAQSSNRVESLSNFPWFSRPAMKELTILGFLESSEVFISIVLIFLKDSASYSISAICFLNALTTS